MHIGIIGRNPHLLASALAEARDLGHVASGTTSDEQALRWLSEGQVQALVIGGGVEALSRTVLIDACRTFHVLPIEVHGPHALRSALAALE